MEKRTLKIRGIRSMDIAVDVLKWVIIILIAGFIGQFGKSLSLHIIDYYKKKREKNKSADPLVQEEEGQKLGLSPPKETPATEQESSIVSRMENSPAEKDPASATQEKNDKALKKALKAQQKSKKKMEKAKAKETK